MSRKIVFASGKGGVGKSTVAANVAVAASQMGEDVVLLDADVPMASLVLFLGLDIEGPTLHEVLSREVDLSEAIYEGPEETKVVPGGISLDGVRKAEPKGLNEAVNKLSEKFETILLDAPSGLGEMALAVLRMSDELVLVSGPVVVSLSDALRTKEVAERFDTKPLGVIVSRRSDTEVDVSDREIESMLDLPILGTVPEDPGIPKATSVGEPIITRDPDSPSSKAFWKLASDIFREREKEDYEELASESISEIKERAQEIDLDYQRLLKVEKKNKNRKTLKKWLKSQIDKS